MAITAKQGKNVSLTTVMCCEFAIPNGEITDYSSRLHYFSNGLNTMKKKDLLKTLGKKVLIHLSQNKL